MTQVEKSQWGIERSEAVLEHFVCFSSCSRGTWKPLHKHKPWSFFLFTQMKQVWNLIFSGWTILSSWIVFIRDATTGKKPAINVTNDVPWFEKSFDLTCKMVG